MPELDRRPGQSKFEADRERQRLAMTVIALAIEPGCPDAALPPSLARRLGLPLLDFRHFERDLAWRSDSSVSAKRPQPIGARSGCWQITSHQLGARYAEMVLRSAADGDALIVSWLAPVLLRTASHVLRVRLGAPSERRAKVLMQQLCYRDIQTARLELASTDSLVARFIARTTGECWADQGHFDLALNAASTPQHLCIRTIAHLAAAPHYRPTEADTNAIENECLKYATEQPGEFAALEPQAHVTRPLMQPSAN